MIINQKFKKTLSLSIVIVVLAMILPHTSLADRAAYTNCINKGGTTKTCQYLLNAPAATSVETNSSANQTNSTTGNSAPDITAPIEPNPQIVAPLEKYSADSNNSSANCPNGVCTLTNPLKGANGGTGINSVSDLILAFMKIVSYLAVILGVIMLMWVGFMFVMARGKPEEIKLRSVQLLWVIVGIGVILGARILISVIINTLQATGTVNPAIIQNAQNAIKNQ